MKAIGKNSLKQSFKEEKNVTPGFLSQQKKFQTISMVSLRSESAFFIIFKARS